MLAGKKEKYLKELTNKFCLLNKNEIFKNIVLLYEVWKDSREGTMLVLLTNQSQCSTVHISPLNPA